MDGPGKYDEACTAAREATKARTVLLVVLDGEHGSGFSVQTDDPAVLAHVPALLEVVAGQIRVDQSSEEQP